MRIVYVLTTLAIGGAERQAVQLAEGIAARGHTAAILVLGPPVADEWPTTLPVTYLHLRKSLFSLIAALIRARRLLAGFNPTLMHSHAFHANIFARLMRLLLRVPVLSTVHNVYEGGWMRMLAYRFTDRLACATAGVSRSVVERYISLKAVHAAKCLVIANGVDETEYVPRPERRGVLRGELRNAGDFVWFTAGRLAPAKDYPNLLRAFAHVHAAEPAAQLWIAGGVRNGLREMENLTADSGLADVVRWLGLRHDLADLLDAADGFVLASAWEGMPLAVAEAMAMEKLVVATDVGGVRELVGECGVLVPAKNAEALGAAMLAAMSRGVEGRRAMGQAARRRMIQSFSMGNRVTEWEKVYRRFVPNEQVRLDKGLAGA